MPSSDPRNYARFIPKEEVEQVAQWRFGAVGSAYSPDQLDAREAEAALVRQELALAQEDAYAKGLADGRAHASAEAKRLCDEFIQAQGRDIAAQTAAHMHALLASLTHGLALSEQTLARGVIELACAVARQVVRHELSVDPLAVRHVVSEALSTLTGDGKPATVRLNPEDMALLKDDLKREFAGHVLSFVPDASLARGDCKVESAGAVIDGRLETRWAQAVSGLGVSEGAFAQDDLATVGDARDGH